ncbi:MAG: lysylphosphatidylglycerol synthase domain-containing protein [Planctomycetaceae bacterium]
MNLLRACLAALRRHWSWLRWPVTLAVLVFLFYQHRSGFYRLASRGADVDFFLADTAEPGDDANAAFVEWRSARNERGFPQDVQGQALRVYAPRPELLHGVTFLALAPEHPLVDRLTTPEQRRQVERLRQRIARLDRAERNDPAAPPSGAFTGSFGVNPLSGQSVPIWISRRVRMSDGAGALAGVPAHNENDWAFARKYELPVRVVVTRDDSDSGDEMQLPHVDLTGGTMIQSGKLNGMAPAAANDAVGDMLADMGTGRVRPIRWIFLLLALIVCAAALVLTFARWYLLVWGLEFPFGFGDALRLGLIGFLFNYVAPGSVGGDIVKAVMIAREQTSRRAVAAATVLLDRVLGLLALFLVGGLVVLIPTPLVQRPEFQTVALVFWIGSLAGLAGLAVILHPATPRSAWLNRLVRLPLVGGVMADLINAVLLYQSRRRVLAAAMGISIVGHLGTLSAFYLCARALHAPETVPGYVAHLQFIPAAEVVGVLVPLPGGIGALEEAVNYFYLLAGALPDDGFLTAIAYRVLTILVAAAGAAFYLTQRREIREALDESPSHEKRPLTVSMKDEG